MAGAGYKLFNTGDVLTAAQVNTYLNEQTVMVFASSAARTTALSGVLAEGMMSYLQDTNAVEVYNGTSWVNVGNAGDITEVQAGVGISIASGTGPIPVITNSSTDLITTAGDLLYGTAADTVARLGIGTAGHVLKVNSGATAPEWAVDPTTDVVTTAGDLIYATGADAVTRLGIGTAGQVLKVNSGATAPEWGAAAASSFVGVSAYLSSNQTISNNTFAAISWNAEYYDTDNFHSLSTNTSRLTVPSGKGGKYLITGSISWAANATETRTVTIYKNGSIVNYLDQMMAVTTSQRRTVQAYNIVIDLVASDYIEIFVWQTSGGNLDVTSDFDLITSVQMSYLGA
jgi:hypothetical protein